MMQKHANVFPTLLGLKWLWLPRTKKLCQDGIWEAQNLLPKVLVIASTIFSKQYQAGCVSKTIKTTVTSHQLIASHSQFSLHPPIHMENSQALPYAQINDRNGVYTNFAMLMQKMMIDHDSDRWIFGQPTFGQTRSEWMERKLQRCKQTPNI